MPGAPVSSSAAPSPGDSKPLSGFTRLGYGKEAPKWSGEPVEAYVEIEDRKLLLDPNQMGQFQRVDIALKASVQVTLRYPEAADGDQIVVQPLDGGMVNKDHHAVVPVRNGRASFHFASSGEAGLFRISIQKGGDNTSLEFWAGTPPVHQLIQNPVPSTRQ